MTEQQQLRALERRIAAMERRQAGLARVPLRPARTNQPAPSDDDPEDIRVYPSAGSAVRYARVDHWHCGQPYTVEASKEALAAIMPVGTLGTTTGSNARMYAQLDELICITHYEVS